MYASIQRCTSAYSSLSFLWFKQGLRGGTKMIFVAIWMIIVGIALWWYGSIGSTVTINGRRVHAKDANDTLDNFAAVYQCEKEPIIALVHLGKELVVGGCIIAALCILFPSWFQENNATDPDTTGAGVIVAEVTETEIEP